MRSRLSMILLGLLIAGVFAFSGWFLSRSQTHATASDATPTRIVSMAPSVTEVLFALGAGETVVGVSAFTGYPPEAAELPLLGGHLDPDIESVAALEPDCIVTMGTLPRVAEHARALDIRLVEVPMDSLQQVYDAIEALGQLTDRADEARAMQKEIAAELTQLTSGSAQQPSPSVVLLVGREPDSLRGLYGVGAASFLNDALAAAGGSNAIAALEDLWPRVPIELIVQADPDIIIELAAGDDQAPSFEPMADVAALAAWRRELPALRAVASGHVYQLRGQGLMIPGPRIPETAKAIAAVLDVWRDSAE